MYPPSQNYCAVSISRCVVHPPLLVVGNNCLACVSDERKRTLWFIRAHKLSSGIMRFSRYHHLSTRDIFLCHFFPANSKIPSNHTRMHVVGWEKYGILLSYAHVQLLTICISMPTNVCMYLNTIYIRSPCIFIILHINTSSHTRRHAHMCVHTNQRCDYLLTVCCYGNGNVSRVPLNSSPSIFPTHIPKTWCFFAHAHTHTHEEGKQTCTCTVQRAREHRGL